MEQSTVGRVTRGGQTARVAGEISFVVACVLVAEWIIPPIFGRDLLMISIPAGIAFVFMFASHRARGETARSLGWRLDNFWPAARLLAAPMLATTALCLAVGWATSSLDFTRWRGGQSIFGVPALGVFWGLLQQYALQGFINRRAQLIWGRGPSSVLVVAAMFALLHLPNPPLTFATFLGGVVWAAVYQRVPNLLALAVSHSLMTWVLVSTLPPGALNGLRVGFKYFG